MNSTSLGLRVAAGIFGLLCLGQLTRLALRFDIVVGTHHVPFWFSIVAVVVLGALAAWLWKLSTPHKPDAPGGAAPA